MQTDRKPTENRHPIIVFDGVCNLCNGAVGFVLRRDRRAVFRFMALQALSPVQRQELGISDDEPPASIVLIDGARVYSKSNAVLRVLARLGGPWALARVALLIPRPLRDVAYSIVARNRYRLFGRRAECAVPDPEVRARFLDELNDADIRPVQTAAANDFRQRGYTSPTSPPDPLSVHGEGERGSRGER